MKFWRVTSANRNYSPHQPEKHTLYFQTVSLVYYFAFIQKLEHCYSYGFRHPFKHSKSFLSKSQLWTSVSLFTLVWMQSCRAAVLLIFSHSKIIRMRILFCCIHFLPEKDKEKETKVWKSIPSPSNNSESSMQWRQTTSYLQHCPTDTVAQHLHWWQHSHYRYPALHCSCPLCLTTVLSKPDSII